MPRLETYKFATALIIGSALLLAFSQPVNAATAKSKAEAPGLLKQAQLLLEKDNNNAALLLLNSLISKEPKNALAYNERARTYGRLGRYAVALEDCNKAIALSPNLPLAYTYRAAIYLVTARYDEAFADSNKALSLNPKLAMAYSMKALVYERLKSYEEEVNECDKAIAIDPKTYRYYVFRASALNELGQHQKALADCNIALSLNSKKVDCYILRGHTYTYLGQFQKALDDFSFALKINRASDEAYKLRATAYNKLGQYQNQINDLTAAIKIAPTQAGLYARRASIYHDLGQLQNSIDDCTKATNLNPTLPEVYSTLALVYEELGLHEKAIAERSKLIELSANGCFDFSNRAKDYELFGKYDLAQADRQKAFSLANPLELASMQLCDPLSDFAASSTAGAQESLKDKIASLLKHRPVVLPFQYDNGGHICVSVQVNDQPLQLMLDSGWGHSELWKQAMPGVAEENEIQMQTTHANGEKYTHGFFSARGLKLGQLTLSNVVMGVNKGLPSQKMLSGFLAGNILEHFAVTIDYAKKEVILAASSEQNYSPKSVIVPMIVRSHRPYCSVKLDGSLELLALLDTGCPPNLAADALLKPVLKSALSFPDHVSGPWLGEIRAENVRLKTLQVGAAELEAPKIEVFPAAQAASAAAELTLGIAFLSKFKKVTFDYLSRRVIFEPY